MTLRKTGKCEDCGESLYGDDYGASGHACAALNKGGTPAEEIALLNAKLAELEKENGKLLAAVKITEEMLAMEREVDVRGFISVDKLMQLWKEKK